MTKFRKCLLLAFLVWVPFSLLGSWLLPLMLNRAMSNIPLEGQSCPIVYFAKTNYTPFFHYESSIPCIASWIIQFPIVLFLFGIVMFPFIRAFEAYTGKVLLPKQPQQLTPEETQAEVQIVSTAAVTWVIVFLLIIIAGPILYRWVYLGFSK
jgi:hypothetical protein